MISGSASGGSTLADGIYPIQVAPGSTLTFQYIGYKAGEYTVPDGRTQVTCNLEMQSDTQALEDVVVIAYGVRKKGTIAGSVSTVKAEKIETTPTAAFDQALQGQVPGLTVLSSSGEPSKSAELTIRGRHAPAIIRRICPVLDSVTALALCDLLAQRFGTDYFTKGVQA